MRSVIYALLSLACFVLLPMWRSTHALDATPEHSGVLLLSHTSFAAAARAFQPLFVLFDAPARKGSLDLFRAFADAAVALRASQRESAPRMRFAFMDVLAASDVPDRLGVVGLPALVRLRCPPKVANLVGTLASNAATVNGPSALPNGTTTTSSAGCSLEDADVGSYVGGRTSAEFQRFMLDQPQREVLVLYDRVALTALIAQQPCVVLVVVDGRDTQPYFDAIALAQTDAGATSFAVSANRALLDSEEEQKQIPSLVVFRDFGATRLVYGGQWRKSAILSFLASSKYSAVSTYSSRFPSFLYDPAAAAHVLLFSDDQLAQHRELVAQVQELALPYASPLLSGAPVRFVLVPSNETALRSSLFVRDRHLPVVLIIKELDAPATRFPLFGRDLLASLSTTTRFKDELGALLAERSPLVFKTAEVTDEDGDDDAFESALADSVATHSQPVGAAAFVARQLQSTVTAENADALSPWELHRQQRSFVQPAGSARWVLAQQQERDVVVSLSSPRCFACREFARVFEQVARVALDAVANAGVVFVTVDVDAVDAAPLGLDFARLPSVFALPRTAFRSPPVAFEGRRFTLPTVLAFVAESCPGAVLSAVPTDASMSSAP